MPILDRLGYRTAQTNSGQLSSVIGPDDRGVKTGIDTRVKYTDYKVAVDPVTRNPVHPDRLKTVRAYYDRYKATG